MSQETVKTHFYPARIAAQSGTLFAENAFRKIGEAGKDGKYKYAVNLTEIVKENKKDENGHYPTDKSKTKYHEYYMRMTEAECNQMKDKLFGSHKAADVIVMFSENKSKVGEGENAKYYDNKDAYAIHTAKDTKAMSAILGGAVDFAIAILGFGHDTTKKLMEVRKEVAQMQPVKKEEPTGAAQENKSNGYDEDLPF